MSPFWLYLHFPSLQLDALHQSACSQSTVEQPIAILDQSQNEVCQLNKTAMQKGVSLSMGLATAAMLAPDLIVIPYHQEAEEKKLKEIAETLYSVTSDITLFPPNGILLRIHNMLNLYGGLNAYWTTIRLQLKPLRLRYWYATGTTPFAARLLARTQKNIITDNCDALKTSLSALFLSQTDLPNKAVTQLKRTGIGTLGELLNVPKASLAKRFDIKFVNYLGRLVGDLQHPVEFYRPKEKFERYLEFLFDVEYTQRLLKPISYLLDTLEDFMQNREWITYSLHITLYQRNSLPQIIEVGSAQGDYLKSAWLPLIELKLEHIKLESPAFALSLKAGVIQQRHSEITDLFDRSSQGVSSSQLLSLLGAKLGEDKLFQPKMVNDHRPEQACQYQLAIRQHDKSSKPFTLPKEKTRLRPSFLFSPPLRLKEKTKLIFGPERICTGWWEDDEVIRDYFIARSNQGQLYWVFRTSKNQDWFVHGAFS